MIPQYDIHGNLPPGVYDASMDEIEARFGGSRSRIRGKLTKNLKPFYQFIRYHASEVYLDGSYITSKISPTDIDIIVVLPAAKMAEMQTMIRLNDFVSSYRTTHLHIFSFFIGVRDDQLSELFTWFTHDRNKNTKGIIRIELRR